MTTTGTARRLRLAVAGAASLLVISACGASETGDEGTDAGGSGTAAVTVNEDSPEFVEFRQAEPGSGEGMKLGYIALDDSIPFSKLVSDGIREQAEIAGAELVFCDSKLDAAEALQCAKNFKTQGVEGYLNFQPVADAAQAVCDAAPQGVPVFAIDIPQGDCQVGFMGANNSRAGVIAGEGLGAKIKEEFDCEYDAYISLEDLGVGDVNDQRMNGIREGFSSVCGEIKNERVLDAGRTDVALTKFADTLTALPEAERIIVVGINDDAVLGALAAARTAGREDQLYMTGMGADPSAHCEIATNPNWAGDAAFFPERYGEIAIPYMIDALKGEEIPAEMYVDHVFVNGENIADFYDVSGC